MGSAPNGRSEAVIPPSPLANEDILPTTEAQRTWNLWHIASLWIGMAVCIPTYMLAAGLLGAGMNWWQAVGTILLGNAIVLVPMALNAYPGARYGIPFPVLIRASFGTVGAHVPSIARALVACGWFGIQTWIGGKAIHAMIAVLFPSAAAFGEGLRETFIGASAAELACFLAFWAIHVWIVRNGMESIKWVETASAPALIVVAFALVGWAVFEGGGLGRVLSASEAFTAPTVRAAAAGLGAEAEIRPLAGVDGRPRVVEMRWGLTRGEMEAEPWVPVRTAVRVDGARVGEKIPFAFRDARGRTATVEAAVAPAGGGGAWLLTVFLPLLTAMVGFWATLSLNIPDFMRYARSQRDQVLGQVIGLPTTMTLYAFAGIVATCAAVLLFDDVLIQEQAPWDPVVLMAHFKSPLVVILSMVVFAVATLTTNVAANVVAPANSFSNLAPRRISYRAGGYATCVLGVLMMPWKLLDNVGAYLFVWLIGYSTLLGPIAGIMIADFYVVRRGVLKVADLYRTDGIYAYRRGWNPAAIAALVLGILPNAPGFLMEAVPSLAGAFPALFGTVYRFGWFAGFAVAFGVYTILMRNRGNRGKGGTPA